MITQHKVVCDLSLGLPLWSLKLSYHKWSKLDRSQGLEMHELVVFDQKLDGWKAWEQGYNHPFSTPFHKKQQEVASFPDSVEEPENEGITQ